MKQNIRKEAAVVGAILIFITGTGLGYLTGSHDQPTEDNAGEGLASREAPAPLERYETFINGAGIECIRDNIAGALSCNFVKFESAVKACEDTQLAKNTFVNKKGETVVFPLIAGECEAKVRLEAKQAFALAEEHRNHVWY